jgi:hypothetical protein
MLAMLTACSVLAHPGALGFQAETNRPRFTFRFEFGCATPDVYDSANNTFTRTWIDFPARKQASVRVALTEQQTDAIVRTVREIDFFAYPEKFSGVPEGVRETTITIPSTSYVLEVRNGTVHRVQWNDGTKPITEQARRLQMLFVQIVDYLGQHPGVKGLPPQFPCE